MTAKKELREFLDKLELEIKNGESFSLSHAISGCTDLLAEAICQHFGVPTEIEWPDKIEFIPKNCGISTREKENNKEFNGYPKGIKNEVISHYQNGYYKGCLDTLDICKQAVAKARGLEENDG